MQRPNLETRRLIGSIPEASDVQVLESLLGDPLVGRTLGGIRSPDQVELLYALLPRFWNRGLATEISMASEASRSRAVPRGSVSVGFFRPANQGRAIAGTEFGVAVQQ